jgi:OmcA/MtrC family decaheme c-type cytochrome
VPYTSQEFDRSVKGAHLVLYKSSQFPGVLIKLLSVANTNPGDRPTVTFSVGSKNGPIDPSTMNRLRFMLSGPNDDYSFRVQEIASNSAVWAGDNTWTYTFVTPLPLDAEGSFTISAEGRNIVPIDFDPGVDEERDNAENPSLAFAVTDAVATPRRTVVEDFNCESCHSNLAFHGGSRHDPQYCDTCHMPEALDFNGDQTIHFKYMIHSIHRGEELEYGFSIGSHDYSDLVYPGDLRNCDACHVNNSQQVPVESSALSTITPQAWWNPMMPNSAACLSCHDDDDSAAHAFSNTVFFGESCGTCHGEGRVAAVDKVHAHQ